MASKWNLLLACTFVTLVLALAAPERAEACSGDLCGCGAERESCLSGCDPADPAYLSCVKSCNRAELHCAICCCCDCPYCPPYCGCGAAILDPVEGSGVLSSTGEGDLASACRLWVGDDDLLLFGGAAEEPDSTPVASGEI